VYIARASEEAGFGCIGASEDDPDAEQIFRDLWEDETQREVVMIVSRRTARSGRGGLRNSDLQQYNKSFKTNLRCGQSLYRGLPPLVSYSLVAEERSLQSA
jgi:hypothetical protein